VQKYYPKQILNNNFEERLKFIDFWANYIKTHPDKVWSKQQNVIIDSQIPDIS